MIFVAALVLMITNLVKSSGAAIGLGVVMIVATPILSAISLKLIDLAPFLKWNPFNIYLGMSNIGMLSPNILKQAMHISQNELIVAYLIYIALMYGIAYLIFKSVVCNVSRETNMLSFFKKPNILDNISCLKC